MTKKPLLLLAMSVAACGMASADTLLVSASGQFSSSDVADSPLVTAGGVFSLSFVVDTSPTPLADSVTLDSFDVPVEDFSYELNNSPVSVTPSEITFFTLADGGLFQVNIGSGFTGEAFDFEGDQAFSGTTTAPVFTIGQFAISTWTYTDPVNFDLETPASGSVFIAPEPSTLLLISSGLVALVGRKFRKR
jgi:hypothetical protein